MSKNSARGQIIKGIAYVCTGFVGFQILRAVYWESKVVKYSSSLRSDKFMSKEELEEKKKVETYLKNHYGRNLMNQLSAQGMMEEEITEQLKAKKGLLAKLKEIEGDKKEIEQLEDDIKKLEDFQRKVNEDRAFASGTFQYPKKDK